MVFMMNVYNGNVSLGASGEATITLPDWFESLNKDFRYQLTCIGGFAPVYVAQEISGNSFKISGGTPGLKVSWQVTGIRKDKFAEAHRIPVEENKTGKELEGIEYEMPYENLEEQTKTKTKHKVVTWELASGEEGTGIVHIAPGCGAEDYDLGMKLKLPKISPLNEEAIFMNGFGDFSGKKYDHVNKEVLRDLEERGFAYKIEPYRHRYPHCWRCGEELVFRLVDEWYIKCSNEIRQNLIKENKKIKWFPEYGKTRQEDWFNNMGDWLISRKRYWGLPLPIWECSCGNIEVIGSLEELKEKAIDKKLVDKLPELHRPWIDEIKIKCSKCKKETSRVLDVGDAWLDAGIVMFSTLNYLTDKKYWQEWYPAEFMLENMP